MLFWRPGGPDRSIVWMGGVNFAEVRLHYREKAPLDPLSGTTLKRDYRSEVFALEVRGSDVRVAPAFEFPGWIIADSVHAVPGGFVFLGGSNDDFAGAVRAVYGRTNGDARKLYDLPADDAMQIIAAVPSPDGKHVAVLEELRPGIPAPPGTELWRVRVGSLTTHELKFVSDAHASHIPYTDGPVWAENAAGVFVRATDRTVSLDARSGTVRTGVAEPACWRLRTNSGGPISEDGVSVYYDDASDGYTVENGEAPCG